MAQQSQQAALCYLPQVHKQKQTNFQKSEGPPQFYYEKYMKYQAANIFYIY